MNRIDTLFKEKQNNILSIYFTAGHPTLDSTVEIITELEKNGANLVEIGMPFSDPLADGPVIQHSAHTALENGMSLNKLFDQLKNIRQTVNIPLILMGYINPILQYGFGNFCQKASEVGIDGLILPDIPLNEYVKHYQKTVDNYDLKFIFLISPETNPERLKLLDKTGTGFNYIVSSSSTTGAKENIVHSQEAYFKRISESKLKNPCLIGFGISNHQTFSKACEYANGAIIGSAFVNALEKGKNDLPGTIQTFVKEILY